MNKLISRYKLLFGCLAVMVLLPVSNLLADDYWDESFTDTSYTEENDMDEGANFYWEEWCIINDPHYVQDISGGFNVQGSIQSWAEADIWSVYDPYENELEKSSTVQLGCNKDWEWTGAPATAPSVDVDLEVDIICQQYTYVQCSDSDEADLYAQGCSFGWGTAGVFDDSSSDVIGCLHYLAGEVDEYGSDISNNFYVGTPYNVYWDGNGPYEYEDTCFGTIHWRYYNTIDDYEVSSGLGEFSAGAYAYSESYSYVDFDYDGGDDVPRTWSIQTSWVDLEASCNLD